MLNSVIEVTPVDDGFATLNSYGFFENPDIPEDFASDGDIYGIASWSDESKGDGNGSK